ncbi:uncharacterized protein EHS24_006341 [Apiotrichum porosum]|uniref:Uncharacterized protein n=1 Tax=Apiotrichum porosum TaxID=105984 RepID=A0A427Y0X3_9TREE|nr:uncharacterized protein EHS24_006341 [Apiotrichum porosum]RSH84814.1 hypothetical protein EHS24_006341 [Apiotrichum porosum]
MPPPLLDYNTFPHIIDLIVSHTPWPTRAVWGRTCKRLRARLLAKQYEHVILFGCFGQELFFRTATLASCPIHMVNVNPQAVDSEVSRIKLYTAFTKVIEVTGFIQPSEEMEHLTLAFPNVETYRTNTRWAERDTEHTTQFPVPCNTLVLFCSERINQDSPRYASCCKVPAGVTKLVLNMRGGNGRIIEHFNVFNLPNTVRDVVVVFPWFKHNARAGTFQTSIDKSQIVKDFVLLLTRGTPKIHYTLVGLNEASPPYELGIALYCELVKHFDPTIKNLYPDIARILRHVRLCTLEEYAGEVDNIETEVVEYIGGDDC